MKHTFLIVVLTLAASSLATAQTTVQGELKQELRAVHQQLGDAFNRGGKAAIERLIADDYVVNPVSGKRFSKPYV